jgi:hypothetical protein
MNQPVPNLSFLTRILIAKSILDVLLLGTLSLVYYYSAFNPHIRGSLDEAGPEWIRGWVLDLSNRDEHVEVQLYIDGRFIESRVSDFPHPQMVSLGLARDEKHGFLFFTPPLDVGQHEARVYAVHASRDGERRTLQQIGKPLTFQTEAAPAEPYFKGWIDTVTARVISGWVVNVAKPMERVEVQLYIDDHFVEARSTDQPRPDLKQEGLSGNDTVGFLFLTPKLVFGPHVVRVYAVRHDEQGRPALRMIGRPMKLTVVPSESDTPGEVNGRKED